MNRSHGPVNWPLDVTGKSRSKFTVTLAAAVTVQCRTSDGQKIGLLEDCQGNTLNTDGLSCQSTCCVTSWARRITCPIITEAPTRRPARAVWGVGHGGPSPIRSRAYQAPVPPVYMMSSVV
eukprot:758862-Hanusia_phi.AAC.1